MMPLFLTTYSARLHERFQNGKQVEVSRGQGWLPWEVCPVLKCSGICVSHLGLFLPLKGLLKLLTVQLYDFAVVEDVRESASFPLLFLGL